MASAYPSPLPPPPLPPSEEATRKAQELRGKMSELEEAERRRQAEAADLERQLEEARALAQRAERRK